ncbi:MAG: hypothetical protein HY201_05315 [Nitrospirae bacterium]|nr:hypothetical protein [Candidatus Troglogloeales bacterium]MBI3598847.1 hypothetical protein [Candidatus Troglogloeales bacterium]
MSLTQMTLYFLGIVVVIIIAMLAHSYLDKKKIKKRLLQLVDPLKGRVSQDGSFHYPHFHCNLNGRAFDLFFDIVKVGRHHILYSIYSLGAALPHPLLLIKKNEFRPMADPEGFLKSNGSMLDKINAPFQGYSPEPQWAEKIYLTGEVKKSISALDEFTSLQCGPDALIAGKPYEGLSDTDSEKTLQAIVSLEKLAKEMEDGTLSAACPA